MTGPPEVPSGRLSSSASAAASTSVGASTDAGSVGDAGGANGKSAPPPPVAAVARPEADEHPDAFGDGPAEVPTDVEAARLAEEESRPDDSGGGVVTP